MWGTSCMFISWSFPVAHCVKVCKLLHLGHRYFPVFESWCVTHISVHLVQTLACDSLSNLDPFFLKGSLKLECHTGTYPRPSGGRACMSTGSRKAEACLRLLEAHQSPRNHRSKLDMHLSSLQGWDPAKSTRN